MKREEIESIAKQVAGIPKLFHGQLLNATTQEYVDTVVGLLIGIHDAVIEEAANIGGHNYFYGMDGRSRACDCPDKIRALKVTEEVK